LSQEKDGKLFLFIKPERANVVGFDHEVSVKRKLSKVSAITVVDLPDGTSVLLIVH
jgi:hypothetical protein